MKTFVQLVTQSAKTQKLSIRKVAREIGLDPSFFSKVLSGKRSPPRNEKILTKLAKLLQIDPMLLIVSTGTIPSEIQPIMENPDFLKTLGKGTALNRPRAPAPAQQRAPYRNSAPVPTYSSSKEISEDLL